MAREQISGYKEAWGKGEEGVTANGAGFLFGVIEVFCSDVAVFVVQLCEYTKIHQNVHFQRMSFIVL